MERLAYAGSCVAAFFGALGLNDWIAIGGLCVAIATFVVHLIMSYRRDRREAALLRSQLQIHQQLINHDIKTL